MEAKELKIQEEACATKGDLLAVENMVDERINDLKEFHEDGISSLEQNHRDQILRLQEDHARDIGEIKKMLLPIAQAYTTANQLGKWTMAILVFLSVLLGVLFSLKSFIIKLLQ